MLFLTCQPLLVRAREKIIKTFQSLKGQDPRNQCHPATNHLPPHPPLAIPIKFSTVDMGPGGLKAIKIMIYGAVLGSNCVRATELDSTLLIAMSEGECNTFLSHDHHTIVRMKPRCALPPSGRLSFSQCLHVRHDVVIVQQTNEEIQSFCNNFKKVEAKKLDS